MLASVLAATLVGLDGRPVRIEADVAPGLPGFTIVGLADIALREARERVRGALRNSGFVHPARRITVNLAPADVPKAGSALDLGIAIAILVGSETVVADNPLLTDRSGKPRRRPLVRIVQGRPFKAGLREALVGNAAARRFQGMRLGDRVRAPASRRRRRPSRGRR
jgi:hypothetical protein